MTVRRVQVETRLLTLSGPGGSGKTRLALAVVEEARWRYQDGVCFLDLAPLSDRALLPEVIATALDVPTSEQHQPTSSLVESLSPRHVLLLLDNCEHLLPECADLVETLLRSCPHLDVVATSRESLGVAGETVWRVPPLAVPPEAPIGESETGSTDSERLFLERARLQRPGFTPTSDESANIAEICRRLDGIPLAIELAAARASVLSVAQIAERLHDRFRLLAASTRGSLPRQQTLRAAMDWSYELLTTQERTVLRALSVFAGGFTLEAAEAVFAAGATGGVAGVAGDEPHGVEATDVLDLLARLVDKSLVLADEREGVVRYRALETVRQYAAELAEQAGEAPAARTLHAQYFLDLAEQAAPAVLGRDQARWHARLDTEHDNLRAALAWLVEQRDAERALRFAAALRWFWYRRRHWEEGFTWPTRVLSLPGAQSRTALRADVLEGAGLFAMWRDPSAAQAMWEESIAINLQHGYLGRTAQTHVFLAWLFIRLWRLDEARARADEALALAEDAGDGGRRAIAQALLASVAARRGDHDSARALYDEALVHRRSSGDVSGRSLLLVDMAKAALLAGDVAEARARAEEALRTAQEAGIRQAVEEELRLIARLALAQGELEVADVRAAELVTHARMRGTAAQADAVALWGKIAHSRGDEALAAARYREAFELAGRLADPGEVHPVLFRDTGDQPGVAVALEGTAELCAWFAPVIALQVAGAADALRSRARQPLMASERVALERMLELARSGLGNADAEQAWTHGRATAIEDAMALAMSVLTTRQ